MIKIKKDKKSMIFDKLKTIKNTRLLRLTGINNITFNKILEILKTEELKKVY